MNGAPAGDAIAVSGYERPPRHSVRTSAVSGCARKYRHIHSHGRSTLRGDEIIHTQSEYTVSSDVNERAESQTHMCYSH